MSSAPAAAVGSGKAANTALAAVVALDMSTTDIPSLDDSFIRKLPDEDEQEDGDDDDGDMASDAGGSAQGGGGGEDDEDDGEIEMEGEEDEACESEGEDDLDLAAEEAALACAAAAAADGQLVTTSPPYTPGQPAPKGLLSALVPCPFDTFEPTIRFAYEGDGVNVEAFPAEIKKLLKWHMTKTTSTLIRKMVANVGFKNTNKKTWLGQWGSHMKAASFKGVLKHQKVNHFPGSFRIGRKDSLWKAICQMQSKHSKVEFDFLAECFLLTRDRARLKRAWEKGFGGAGKQKWIIKPNASARGIGIRVVTDFAQVPKKKSVLVQRYLSHPYLINQTKFDLRIYVYVTSYDPLRVYVCTDGLVRFATQKYSNKKGSAGNRFMHLTNYSINKKSDDFVANDDANSTSGHKWGMTALWKYMREERGVDTAKVWSDMCGVILKTLMAADGPINSQTKSNTRQRSCVHELFGFDIFLDNKLKPWVIEVNISPSLHSQSKLDKDIKGRCLRDLFNLSGYRLPPEAKGMEAEASECSSSSSSSRHAPPRAEQMGPRTLTSEEKAKHAYYNQKHGGDRETIIDNLTTDDVLMLMETENEHSRRGAMQRMIPAVEASPYLKYTDTERYYNTLCDVWTHRWAEDPAKGVAFLQSLASDAGARKPGELYKPATFKIQHHRKFVSPTQIYRAAPLSQPKKRPGSAARSRASSSSSSLSSSSVGRNKRGTGSSSGSGSSRSNSSRSSTSSKRSAASPRRPTGSKPPTGAKRSNVRGAGAGAGGGARPDSGVSSAHSTAPNSRLSSGSGSSNSPRLLRRARADSGGGSASSRASASSLSVYDSVRDGAVPGDSYDDPHLHQQLAYGGGVGGSALKIQHRGSGGGGGGAGAGSLHSGAAAAVHRGDGFVLDPRTASGRGMEGGSGGHGSRDPIALAAAVAAATARGVHMGDAADSIGGDATMLLLELARMQLQDGSASAATANWVSQVASANNACGGVAIPPEELEQQAAALSSMNAGYRFSMAGGGPGGGPGSPAGEHRGGESSCDPALYHHQHQQQQQQHDDEAEEAVHRIDLSEILQMGVGGAAAGASNPPSWQGGPLAAEFMPDYDEYNEYADYNEYNDQVGGGGGRDVGGNGGGVGGGIGFEQQQQQQHSRKSWSQGTSIRSTAENTHPGPSVRAHAGSSGKVGGSGMLSPASMSPSPASYLISKKGAMPRPRKLVPRTLPKLDPRKDKKLAYLSSRPAAVSPGRAGGRGGSWA